MPVYVPPEITIEGGVVYSTLAPTGSDQAGAAPIVYTPGVLTVVDVTTPSAGNEGIILPTANTPMFIQLSFINGDPTFTFNIYVYPASGDQLYNFNGGTFAPANTPYTCFFSQGGFIYTSGNGKWVGSSNQVFTM